MHTHVCVRRHELAYTARVLESYERQVFCIKAEVWNESHIIWEPFQTPIFQLYKTLHGIFQRTEKIQRENTRFTRNSESKSEFFTKYPQVNFLLIVTFSSLNLRVLKFINQFCLVVNRFDWGERSKSSQRVFVFEVQVLNLLFLFSCYLFVLIFLFPLFFLITQVIICLSSLGFPCFIISCMLDC